MGQRAVRGQELMPNRSLSVLVVDDDSRFRGSVVGLLAEVPGVRVLGEAGDGDEAVRLAIERRPQVVLMDITMPGAGGLEAIRRTKAVLPDTKVIVITMHAEAVYQRAAAQCGADGFVLKKNVRGELLSTLYRVAGHA